MSVPLCRCRVLYVGSAIPTVTKDGLQGIQQPLKERYRPNGTEVRGIDSWLSVWSNGVLIEYIDGNTKSEGAFYPIINLHYCAAVRYTNAGGSFGTESDRERFVPLDSAFFMHPESQQHPPIFAAIFRRSTGIKVLECHAFICTNERAANALVRSCFHSYADTAFLKIEDKLLGRQKAIKNGSVSERPDTPSEQQTSEQLTTDDNRDDDINWDERAIGQKTWQRRQQSADYDMLSTESSIHKKAGKRNKKNETQSEIFENNGMIIPYNEPMRRTGSQPDISRPFEPHQMPFHPPPPHFFPPGPASRGRPPPHMFMPPHQRIPHGSVPPPQFFARFGGRPVPMPPPHMHPMFGTPHPQFGRHPPYGHPMMFMPPPPHFAYSPPHQRAAPTVPIIESIYDTYPRRGGYDESIYMPSNGTLPPNSTYKPGGPYEHYEGFYETYKRPGKASGIQQSDSDTSVDDSQFWETYETGAYRKVNPNNRNGTPKMNGEKSPAPTKAQNYGDSTQSKQRSDSYVHQSTPKIESRTKQRPTTPEIDYDNFGNVQITDKSGTHQSNRQAAVF